MRHDGRSVDQLRELSIEPNFIGQALGSALITCGRTRVICTATLDAKVPKWLKDGGWLTAEYAMLPGATGTRGRRDPGGRGKEIQRLIGRSLRASVDLGRLMDGEMPLCIYCDCDVIEADGGTRTASISGAYVALKLAIARLQKQGRLKADPTLGALAAVSVGIIKGDSGEQAVVDLDYVEDSTAVVDLNLVMRQQDGQSGLVEVQGTGEHGTFSRAQLDSMLDLGATGIEQIIAVQADAIARGVQGLG